MRIGDATVLDWALRALAAAGLMDPVVVVPPGHEEDFAAIASSHGVTRIVTGGATRTDSVRAGVDATDADCELVAVHDAARPLMPAETVVAAIDAVTGDVVAAAPALPVADTLKRVEDDVVSTVDRCCLHAVQTPQVFRGEVLRALLVDPASDATDELALVERALADGAVAGRIVLVPGSLRGIKITSHDDLALVRDLLARHHDTESSRSAT